MNAISMTISITSEYPERLAAFYRDIVGLNPGPDVGSCALRAGSNVLLVSGHSETSGDASEPQRLLINFVVEDPAAEQARLEKVGVRFIRSASLEPCGGHIATFLDPDGNYCQLIEHMPNLHTACDTNTRGASTTLTV